jgi:hypothetical protein
VLKLVARGLLRRRLRFDEDVNESLCTVWTTNPPIAAEGSDWNLAADDFVAEIREYDFDWIDHLHGARNHRGNWLFTWSTSKCSDAELRSIILRRSAASTP